MICLIKLVYSNIYSPVMLYRIKPSIHAYIILNLRVQAQVAFLWAAEAYEAD